MVLLCGETRVPRDPMYRKFVYYSVYYSVLFIVLGFSLQFRTALATSQSNGIRKVSSHSARDIYLAKRRCKKKRRPKKVTVLIKNMSNFPLEAFLVQRAAKDAKTSNPEFESETLHVAQRSSKRFKFKPNKSGGLFEFFASALNLDGTAAPLQAFTDSVVINRLSARCKRVYRVTIDETDFPGSPTNEQEKYVAYITPDKVTCCTTPEGVKTFVYQSTRFNFIPADATLISATFPSDKELKEWICDRPIMSHFWEGTWAEIGGYSIARIPCSVTVF